MTSHPSHPDPVDAAKKALRARCVALRRQACVAGGDEAGAALAGFADGVGLPAGAVVAGYWPMGDEIDPRPLMAALAGQGHPLALPVVTARGQKLDFRAWRPGDLLEPGPHGTLHPEAAAPVLVPDVVLVPLLAFDSRFFRLGYGGGYYDRTLEHLRAGSHVKAIGLAFAAQRVDDVPRGAHDQPLDAILTEAGLLTMETS